MVICCGVLLASFNLRQFFLGPLGGQASPAQVSVLGSSSWDTPSDVCAIGLFEMGVAP